jgi:pimeloyl-ACP methyl ester carboxylesterase
MDVRNGSVRLNVVVDGPPDAPTVVLFHGITQSTATWSWFVEHLAPRYRVVRVDARGHGGSDRTPGGYSYLAGYVPDAIAVLEQLDCGPCLLVGHSLGGGTSAAVAQRRPDLVAAMVLEDPPLAPPRARVGGSLMTTFAQVRASLPRLQASGIPHAKLVDVLAASPSVRGTTLGAELHADAIAAMATGMLQLDPTVLDPVIDGTMTPAFDPFSPLTVPTMIVAADPTSPDCVARPDDLDRVQAASPLVQVETVRGATHLLHDELANRDRFAALTSAFLAAHGGVGQR